MSEKKHSSSSRSERGESRRSHRSSGRAASESGASRRAGSDVSIGPPPSYCTRAEPQDATQSNSGRPPSERHNEVRARSSYNGSSSGMSKHDDMQPYSSSTKQRKPSTPDEDDDMSVNFFQGTKSSIKDRIGGMFGKSKKSSGSERLDGSSSYGSVPPYRSTAGSEAGSGQRRRRSARVDDRFDRGMGRLDVVKEEDFEGSMADQEPEEPREPSAPSASVQRWMDRVPLTEDAVASFNAKAQPGRKGAQSETPVSNRRMLSQERTPMSIAPGESAFSTVEPSDLTPRPLPRRAQSTAPTYHTTQVPTRNEAPRSQAPRIEAPRSEVPSYRTVDPRREIQGPKTRIPEADKKDSTEQDEIEAAIKESMKDLAITARSKGDVKQAGTRFEAEEWNEDEINAAIQQSIREATTSQRGDSVACYETNNYLTSHKLEQDLAAQREKEAEEAARRRSDDARRRREDELNARIKKDAEDAAHRRREAEVNARIRRDAEDAARRPEEAELDARIKQDAEDAARRRRREVGDAVRRRREAELEALIKKDAEDAARLRNEAEDAARRRREAEMEARIRKDAEDAAHRRREADDAACRRREAEIDARIKRDAEDAARLRREAEDANRRREEAEADARIKRDTENAARRRREAEEARIKKDTEDAARRVQEMTDAAARRRKEAEDLDRQRRDAEDAARRKRESDEADRRHEARLREVKHAAKLEKQAIAEQEREAEHAAEMRELELAEKARQIASIARERDEAIARKAREEEIALQRRTAEEQERLAAERSRVEDEKRELEKKRIEAQYRTMERTTSGQLASDPVGDRSLVPCASTGVSTYPQAPNHTPRGIYTSSALIPHPVTVQSQVTVTQSALSPHEHWVQPSSQPSFPQPASQTQQSSTSTEDIYRPPRRHGMIMPDIVTRVQQHYRFRRSLVERSVRDGRRGPEGGPAAIATLNRNEVADIDALSRRTEELDFPLMEALEADIELLDRLGGDIMAPPVPWSLSSESASHGNTHIGHLREHINRLLTQQGGNAMASLNMPPGGLANLGSGSRLNNSGGIMPGGTVQFFYEEEYFFLG